MGLIIVLVFDFVVDDDLVIDGLLLFGDEDNGDGGCCDCDLSLIHI